MIELEVLFNSGQGIIVPLEDRETALRFMKQAMDAKHDNSVGLVHLSTSYDEMLIDMTDICFIRMKKETLPLGAATLKIPAVAATRNEDGAPAQADKETEKSNSDTNPKVQESVESKSAPLNSEYEALQTQRSKVEEQIHKAEERLKKIEQQSKRVEEELKQEREKFEDAAREAKLKSSIESIEIEQEITRMKDK
jgi:flagellar motility protein MotE (MotC chaperone)